METVFESVMKIIASIISLGAAITVLWTIVCYLVSIYPKYYMFKSAGIATWTAFIPILSDAMLLKIVGWSPWWYVLIYLCGYIPAVGWLFAFVINAIIGWKVAANFGLGDVGKFLSLFFGGFVHWYIALTKKQYIIAA